MPTAEIKEIVPASAKDVFALIHDYQRRLEWDTLLRKAYLEPDFPVACQGAVSVCQGKFILGGFALRTIYLTFEPDKVAAVKMLNQPPFFDTFAASIRHFEISENSSEVSYKFNFTAKPKSLRWFLNPIMSKILAWETKRRLQSLKKFFAEKPPK